MSDAFVVLAILGGGAYIYWLTRSPSQKAALWSNMQTEPTAQTQTVEDLALQVQRLTLDRDTIPQTPLKRSAPEKSNKKQMLTLPYTSNAKSMPSFTGL